MTKLPRIILTLLAFYSFTLSAQIENEENSTITKTVTDTVKIYEEKIVYLKEIKSNGARLTDVNKKYNRWVRSPIFTPGLVFFGGQKSDTDEKIQLTSDFRFLVGSRVERYFPNAIQGYGFEIDLNTRTLTFEPNDSRYIVYEQGAAFTPFFLLKKGKYDAHYHPDIEIGIRNQFVALSSIKYNIGDGSKKIDNPDFLRKYRTWLVISAGWKKDLYNQSEAFFGEYRNTRANLSDFRIRMHLPLFEQGNTFRESAVNYPEAFSIFRKSKSFIPFFTFSYTQQIDWRKNAVNMSYRLPNGLVRKSEGLILPPLVNNNLGRKNIYGNLFVDFEVLPPAVDSLYIAVPDNDTLIVNIGRAEGDAGNFSLGYVLHLLGNNKKFIDEISGEDINAKGLNWDLYVFGGVGLRRMRFSNLRPAILNNFSAEVGGGIKIGIRPPGIYLDLGYSYTLPIRQRIIVDDTRIKDFDFSNLGRHVPYAGLSLRNGFFIRFKYFYELQNLKVEERSGFMEKVAVSIGFGR